MPASTPAALTDAVAITTDAAPGAPVVLTRVVELDRDAAEVSSARLVATAHGVYEPRLDGEVVTDSVLDPGWTAYEWRLQVQSFDVTERVRAGARRLEITLASGWWCGGLGFEGADANYGEKTALLAALEVTYADGSTQRIATGPNWGAHTGEIVSAGLYDGERIDARRRGDHGVTPLAVRATEFDRGVLIEQASPPVRRHETLAPERIWTSPAGATLVDFGQNLVGWVRLRVPAGAVPGTEVTLRHAEVLENDELGVRPLRGAKATDVFVLSGEAEEFEPTLTFHGFRYVEVTGFPGDLTVDDLRGVVVHSEMTRTGAFECSDPLVNRLVLNSVWGQRGNFLAVPTDCPQRDERLGWTGDIAAFAATAAFQFDVADFLHSWLLDLEAETRHNPKGYVPFTVPDVLKYANFPEEFAAMAEMWAGATAVWGDASVWVPQALWNAYGDRDRLAAQYPGMVLHLESVERVLSPTGLWDGGFQFGDWLDPDAPPDQPQAAKADTGVVATACLFRSASFAAEAARELGHAEDAQRWSDLAARTRVAFVEHYVREDGTIRSDCATVYALAICFGLVSGEARAAAGRRLAEVVAERGYVVTTGFAGTPFVTWALSETGHVDAAYRLLLERSCPSWLYPVTMGATTIWERWDSMLPDGSINPGDMTSFNHYALGAVADWLYQVVAGLRPAAPGYARLHLQPTPGEGLDHARAELDSPVGRIACGWRREGDGYVVEVNTPAGVPTRLVLPDGTEHTWGEGDDTDDTAARARTFTSGPTPVGC